MGNTISGNRPDDQDAQVGGGASDSDTDTFVFDDSDDGASATVSSPPLGVLEGLHFPGELPPDAASASGGREFVSGRHVPHNMLFSLRAVEDELYNRQYPYPSTTGEKLLYKALLTEHCGDLYDWISEVAQPVDSGLALEKTPRNLEFVARILSLRSAIERAHYPFDSPGERVSFSKILYGDHRSSDRPNIRDRLRDFLDSHPQAGRALGMLPSGIGLDKMNTPENIALIFKSLENAPYIATIMMLLKRRSLLEDNSQNIEALLSPERAQLLPIIAAMLQAKYEEQSLKSGEEGQQFLDIVFADPIDVLEREFDIRRLMKSEHFKEDLSAVRSSLTPIARGVIQSGKIISSQDLITIAYHSTSKMAGCLEMMQRYIMYPNGDLSLSGLAKELDALGGIKPGMLIHLHFSASISPGHIAVQIGDAVIDLDRHGAPRIMSVDEYESSHQRFLLDVGQVKSDNRISIAEMVEAIGTQADWGANDQDPSVHFAARLLKTLDCDHCEAGPIDNVLAMVESFKKLALQVKEGCPREEREGIEITGSVQGCFFSHTQLDVYLSRSRGKLNNMPSQDVMMLKLLDRLFWLEYFVLEEPLSLTHEQLSWMKIVSPYSNSNHVVSCEFRDPCDTSTAVEGGRYAHYSGRTEFNSTKENDRDGSWIGSTASLNSSSPGGLFGGSQEGRVEELDQDDNANADGSIAQC